MPLAEVFKFKKRRETFGRLMAAITPVSWQLSLYQGSLQQGCINTPWNTVISTNMERVYNKVVNTLNVLNILDFNQS